MKEKLKELTTEEKAALVSGTDFMYTNAVPRVGIPEIRMADGPHGLRKQTGMQDNGMAISEPSTAFPTAACTASGWNTENAEKIGAAIAEECLHYGVQVLLGPGVNIKRNPRCGRNFEYYSEDPLLAGQMAAAQIRGTQNKGVGACVKHFALNSNENFRFMGDSVCDARAMREIYFKPFEIAVKTGKPHALMCAYNRVDGTFCSENKFLLDDVLRKEWGYDGVTMTDWGAARDRVRGLTAGMDLEMPGDTAFCRKAIIDGVQSGNLPEEALDRCVERVLAFIERYKGNSHQEADFQAHHILAAEIAADCAVLMKNEAETLPLCGHEKFCVWGDLFEKMRYQGAGSSMINAIKITSPKNAFDERNVPYVFARGYAENVDIPNRTMEDEAVALAENADTILLFVGLTDYAESEGGDRAHLSLPENQLSLIRRAVETGKKTVVVLYGGSVVELPFADEVYAILHMFLPGQNGGTATAQLLFGEKNPCGKLSETWVKNYKDVPFGNEYATTVSERYKESVFVGYRYYQTANVPVRYPFGYGLSYTKFSYKDINVERIGEKIYVYCTVKNIGERDGAEITQLYVQAPETQIFKPVKELRAFAKTYLRAGESKRVTLCFDEDDLRVYDPVCKKWRKESGTYVLQVCSDVQTVCLSATVYVDGERLDSFYSPEVLQVYRRAQLGLVTDATFEKLLGRKLAPLPAKKPFTMESPFTDMKYTFWGRLVYGVVMGILNGQLKRARRLPEGSKKEYKVKGILFKIRIIQSDCLSAMTMCEKMFPYNVAEGLMHIVNGRIFKGLGRMLKKIKVPKLPKYQK